jgi:putative tricarboxylic transport membrane protein
VTAAISLFLFGAVTAALSMQYPLGTLRMPGSGFFPLLLGVMLMGLAAAQAAQLLLARPKPAAAPEPKPAVPAWRLDDAARRVLLFIGVVALATALLQPIGYVAANFLLMLGLLRVFGGGWRASVLIAACSAIASYVLFVRWLEIPMPAGPFGF